MNAMRFRTVAHVLAGAFATLAFGDSFTFAPQSGNSGDWNVPENWSPTTLVPPGLYDDVTIPAGKTCRVAPAPALMQRCFKLTVESGATLVIELNNLEIGDDLTGTPAQTSVIDGIVEFRGGAGSVLQLQNGETLTGSGEIRTDPTATDPDDRYGEIFRADTTPVQTAGNIAGTLTLRGSIVFNMYLSISSGVQVICDNAADEMFFGPDNNNTYEIGFSGTLLVSAGKVQVRRMKFDGSTGRFEVSGGELELGRFPENPIFTPIPTMTATQLTFEMSGGLLDVQTGLGAKELDFTGGTIEVAKEVSAFWSP